MFKNYFKVALRSLWKFKGYSAINIFGLALGLATCLLIIVYVLDELSYDKYNKKADRIYRVDSDVKFGGTHFVLAVAPDPLGATLKKDFPQVEQYTRFRGYGGFLVKKGDQNLQEDNVIYADSTLFDVFTLPIIEGDARTALKDPNSVVITEKTAKKYFNTVENVVGKTLIINDTTDLKVTAIIKNIPSQSHFNFDFYVSLNGAVQSWELNSWVSNNFNTYIVLKEGADPKKLAAQFGGLVEKYIGPQIKDLLNINMEEFTKSGNFDRFELMPLTQIHLHSNKTAELGPNSNIQFVYIFSAIAIFILLIACVNFMNLSTARSSNRAKEVGVRKVLGSMRSQLVSQFLSESLLISFISLVFALVFALILLPLFNQLSGKELVLGLFSRPLLLPALIVLVLIVGLFAGGYPAFFLSSFQPVSVLKGKLTSGFRTGWLRSSLVVFQFAISMILIVGTAVIYGQLNYIRNKELGFDREHVLIIQNTSSLGNEAKIFKQELLNIQGIKSITTTGFLPTGNSRNDSPLFPDASLNQKSAVSMQTWYVDADYIPTLGMKMIRGRNFSPDHPTDSSGVIINEAAAKLLAFSDPLNKPLYYITDLQKKQTKAYNILGVVKDFNFNSLREAVTPMALFLSDNKGSMALRIQTSDIKNLTGQIQAKWKKMVPGQPFTYSFMDDDFNNIYRAEQRIGKIAISFSVLAILIACLGLFGLVTYAAEQRTKEIGIRKVLGATVSNIVRMLSKDFLKLVLIASIIAFPIAWWSMNKWLQDFSFRIHIHWSLFLITALFALAIALFTVSFQAIKAAVANPVKNLRTE